MNQEENLRPMTDGEKELAKGLDQHFESDIIKRLKEEEQRKLQEISNRGKEAENFPEDPAEANVCDSCQ